LLDFLFRLFLDFCAEDEGPGTAEAGNFVREAGQCSGAEDDAGGEGVVDEWAHGGLIDWNTWELEVGEKGRRCDVVMVSSFGGGGIVA